MTKVVIDTNVVVSGLLFGGVPGDIVCLWKDKRILPYATKDIIEEYITVLAYPKFQLTHQEIEYLLYREILPSFEIVDCPGSYTALSSDPSDDKFLHCALAQSVHVLITGDRHLLDLPPFQSLSILSPATFLQQFIIR